VRLLCEGRVLLGEGSVAVLWGRRGCSMEDKAGHAQKLHWYTKSHLSDWSRDDGLL
jgi:hypothetical protein